MNEEILAREVVDRAIYEWRVLARGVPEKAAMKDILRAERKLRRLRKFFNSDWCKTLLMSPLDHKRIVKQMEGIYQGSVLQSQIMSVKRGERE